MRDLFRRLSVLVVAAAVAILSGCAAFEGNKLPRTEPLSPVASVPYRPTASLVFKARSNFAGNSDAPEAARALMEQELTGTLTESGYFQLVGPGTEGDVRIAVTMVEDGNPAALVGAFITGLSLYVIPSWVTAKYTANVTVSGPGVQEKSYQLQDQVTMVQWLPMIFVAPAKGIIKVPTDVRKNMWRNLVIQMQGDGILPWPQQPAS